MEKTAVSLVVAALMHVPVFGDSPLSVFYDFKDGADGTEVNTVTDDSGTYTGEAHATNSNGQKPKFSSDGPGRVIVRDGVVVCADPHSLSFRYKEDSTHQSGYVDIPGLASALAGRAAFTVEYFVKMVEDYDYSGGSAWDRYSKTAFYLKSATSAFKQIAPGSADSSTHHAKNLVLQRYKDSVNGDAEICTSGGNLSGEKWYHIAIVFAETDQSTHEGALAFYVNGTHVGTARYANASGGDLKFRIGSGYLDIGNNADRTTTESIHASLSCLRVSGTALSTSEFMVVDATPDVSGLDTIAFYDFKDGTSGDVVASVTNGVDSSLFPGTGSVLGGSITFSSQCPAAKIYGSSRVGDVLVENPQSVHFESGRSNYGGKLSLASLATSLSRLDAYTVEFFFKMEAYDRYRTMAAWKFGDEVAVKVNMDGSAGSYPGTPGAYSSCAMEPLTNKNGSVASVSRSLDLAGTILRRSIPVPTIRFGHT